MKGIITVTNMIDNNYYISLYLLVNFESNLLVSIIETIIVNVIKLNNNY